MNVLFLTTFNVCPQNGGTERITYSLAKALNSLKENFECFSLYKIRHEFNYISNQDSIFKNEEQAESVQEITDYIRKNSINICIAQGMLDVVKPLKKELQKESCDCKVIFVHHFSPGFEANFITVRHLVNSLTHGKLNFKLLTNLLLYPAAQFYKRVHLRFVYRNVYSYSDKVVLLSANFIPIFSKYAFVSNPDKFFIIPNMLSYPDYIDEKRIPEKKKHVLIVSRLDENQKKIKSALKIWKIVKKDERAADWKLIIVGESSDKKFSEIYAAKNHLQNVDFEGQREPKNYYLDSSIFMLTSKSEGWGLTLTEAQQFGCVPLAFDTYASLGDIITRGRGDGFVIPKGKLRLYADKIIGLMTDEKLRYSMAVNGIKSSARFAPDAVVDKWCELFKSLDGDDDK